MHALIDLINALPDLTRLAWMHTPIAHVLYWLVRLFGAVVFEDGSIGF